MLGRSIRCKKTNLIMIYKLFWGVNVLGVVNQYDTDTIYKLLRDFTCILYSLSIIQYILFILSNVEVTSNNIRAILLLFKPQ